MDIDIDRLKVDANYWCQVAPYKATHVSKMTKEFYQCLGDGWVRIDGEKFLACPFDIHIVHGGFIPRPCNFVNRPSLAITEGLKAKG